MQEEAAPKASATRNAAVRLGPNAIAIDVAEIGDEPRRPTGIAEFDRVLGGGVVPGALMLIGGDPGIGKSTLLTQVANLVGSTAGPCLYVSGEESVRQIKLRAQRLGALSSGFLVACETELPATLDLIERTLPQLAIVDSVQTLSDPELESAPATVSQVRACATALQRLAKSSGIPIFIVGHVTKDGAIAGPKALEHLVDTVLYFEGDSQGAFRVLRAVKNRFGATDEIGVFEMGSDGLRAVENASATLLAERSTNVPGSAVIATMEGSRSMLAEIQALSTPSYLNTPRRVLTGVDYNRMCLVMAVMEKRLGFRLANHDVFLNVAGGMKIIEPAADLAALTAIASSARDRAIRGDCVLFGEVGLGGEVRAVNHVERRLGEAARMGFARAVVPHRNAERLTAGDGIEIIGVRTVREALDHSLTERTRKRDADDLVGNDPFDPE